MDARATPGEHRHSETAAEKTDSRSHGSPANRAHSQRIRLSDRRIRQQHENGQGGPERRHQEYSNPVRFQDRQQAEHDRYPKVAAQAKRGPRPQHRTTVEQRWLIGYLKNQIPNPVPSTNRQRPRLISFAHCFTAVGHFVATAASAGLTS